MKIRASHREGTLLIVVLACIGIALALTMVAMQTSIKQRRHLSRTLQVEQTRLLLDAAANSKEFKQWRKTLGKADDAKPLKISFKLPNGKPAEVTAKETEEKDVLLSVLIGDAKNETTVTRRSRSFGKEEKPKKVEANNE